VDIIREPIESRVNKRGNGQFIPNQQSSDKDRSDIQYFHHQFCLCYFFLPDVGTDDTAGFF